MRPKKQRILAVLLFLALLLQLLNVAPGAWLIKAHARESEIITTVLYEQNFDSYTETVTLVKDKTVEDWHLFGNASGTISDGVMTLSGTQNGHIQLDIPGASEWSNYTVEVDMTYINPTNNWVGVAYNSQSDENHQKGGIFNVTGYFLNGRYNKTWTNNDPSINNTNSSLLSTAVNKPFRLKIESFAQSGQVPGCARLSVAYYNGSTLGDWIVLPVVDNIDYRTSKGSIGFAMPSGGLAKVTVDNICVYKNAEVLYREDFSEYDGDAAVTITEGRTGGGWKMDCGPGSVTLDDQRMNLSGESGDYSHLFLDLEEAYQWRNYILEADLNYTKANWVGLAYNAQSFRQHQKAGVYGTSTYVLNGRDDYSTGNNPGWVNDIKTGENANHTSSSAFRITLGKTMRLRVVTSNMTGKNEGTTALYIAWYDDAGVLGDWTHIVTVNNIHSGTWKGTIGVVIANSAADAWIDNILVYKYEGSDPYEPPPPEVAEIYIPESGIVNPPVVAQLVTDALPAAEGERPAVAVMDIDEELNLLSDSGEVLATLQSWYETYRYSIIPALVVDSQAEATAASAWLLQNGYIDAYILADEADIALVTEALEVHHSLRGGIFVDSVGETEAQWAALCAKINNDAHVTQLISRAPISVDTMTYFNNHAVALWGMAESTAECYRAVSSGYHGIMTRNPGMVYRLYRSITMPTVSGRPIPIAHRGAHLQQGLLPNARGENTVDSFLLALQGYGCLGVETDLKITSDGEIILHHDPEMTRVTDIEERPEEYTKGYQTLNYTLEELKKLNIDYMERKTTDHWTGKLNTFLEALEATEELGLVYYCHISHVQILDRFNEILEQYPQYVDNCVIFIDSGAVNYTFNYKVLDHPVPITFAHNGMIDNMLAKETDLEVLQDMILLMNKHNGHPLYYHYEGHATEDFYYEVAARGYVTIHSITNGQTNLNDRLLLKQGAVSLLTDTPWMCDDYHYYVDAPATVALKAGEALDTTHNIPMVLGALEQQECGITQVSGVPIIWDDALNGYTAHEAGEAVIVFYLDRVADGGAEYRVYSQPVTVRITADPAAVSLNVTEAQLEVGQTLSLFATVQPLSAQDQTVIWSCDDETVVCVDKNGVVVALAPGEATVTVTTRTGGKTASCKVTVLPPADEVLAVMDAIDQLDPVTLQSGEAIRAARAAYEALSYLRKAQVTNYAALLEAEGAYMALLEQGADPLAAAKHQAAAELQELASSLSAKADAKQKEAIAKAKADAEAAVYAADSVAAVETALEAGRKAMNKAMEQKPASNPFRDVKKDAFYYDSVLWAVEKGVTSGVSPTTFEPGASCTRGQVVTFLWRAKGEPKAVNRTNPFRDVKEDAFYYEAVLWAVENGITSGTSKDTFSPSAPCTRGQVVTFLWRTMGKPQPASVKNPFKDVKQDAFYYDSVLWAVEAGITSGTSKTQFSPSDPCTRGQVVTFLFRTLN